MELPRGNVRMDGALANKDKIKVNKYIYGFGKEQDVEGEYLALLNRYYKILISTSSA